MKLTGEKKLLKKRLLSNLSNFDQQIQEEDKTSQVSEFHNGLCKKRKKQSTGQEDREALLLVYQEIIKRQMLILLTRKECPPKAALGVEITPDMSFHSMLKETVMSSIVATDKYPIPIRAIQDVRFAKAKELGLLIYLQCLFNARRHPGRVTFRLCPDVKLKQQVTLGYTDDKPYFFSFDVNDFLENKETGTFSYFAKTDTDVDEKHEKVDLFWAKGSEDFRASFLTREILNDVFWDNLWKTQIEYSSVPGQCHFSFSSKNLFLSTTSLLYRKLEHVFRCSWQSQSQSSSQDKGNEMPSSINLQGIQIVTQPSRVQSFCSYVNQDMDCRRAEAKQFRFGYFGLTKERDLVESFCQTGDYGTCGQGIYGNAMHWYTFLQDVEPYYSTSFSVVLGMLYIGCPLVIGSQEEDESRQRAKFEHVHIERLTVESIVNAKTGVVAMTNAHNRALPLVVFHCTRTEKK